MALKGFLRGVGEAVGFVKPRTREIAGTKVFEELQKQAYQYRPEAFQLGPVSGAEAQAARQQYAAFGEALKRRAAGEVPSQAEMQLQAGQQRAQQSLQAALAGLRGRQAGLGLRGLQQQFAEQGQTMSQQAAQLRAAEQAGAEQQLAQFFAQRAQTEMAAQDMAMREALIRQQLMAELEKLRASDITERQRLAMGGAGQARQTQQQSLGALLSALGAGAAAMSGGKGK